MYSAKVRNISWDITKEDIDDCWERQKGRCIYSGLPLGDKGSLDRIDSTRGYSLGNIQLVVREINFMKGSLTHAEFKAYCRLIAAHEERYQHYTTKVSTTPLGELGEKPVFHLTGSGQIFTYIPRHSQEEIQAKGADRQEALLYLH
jgi:hypothetical protein